MDSNGKILKSLTWINIQTTGQKDVFSKLILNTLKNRIRELHNDYPLAPGKTETKREMLSEYQLKIADLCKIPIVNFKKLEPNFFDKIKYVLQYENLQLYLRLGLKI